MPRPELSEYQATDTASAATYLAHAVADDLRTGLAQRGAATLIVSGGRSPLPFFAALRTQPLQWANVTITLADERWVPSEHADSNEALIRSQLLRDAASEAHFFGLKSTAESPAAALSERSAALRRLPRPFDAVVLGMGNDGHTASLFPGTAELADGLDLDSEHELIACTPASAAHARISLSLRALCNSRRIYVLFEGEEKNALYARAKAGGSPTQWPICAVLQQHRVPVHVCRAP